MAETKPAPTQDEYREYARHNIARGPRMEIEIDDDAEVKVMREDAHGAWVQAWVWVDDWKVQD